MIFTLHRYIFRELFKVFLLTATVLSLVLSTGLMLRPIQEYGVAPDQIINLLGYFLPITLTFVFPMSALFASALVYGRFANDRELEACRASGISLLTLVYPGLFLAICVSIASLVLNFYVAPNFVHRAERAVKANAKQILFRNLQRHGYFATDDNRYVIYADTVDPENNILEGVIIIESKDNKITQTVMSETALIQIDAHSKFNDIMIIAKNTERIDKSGFFESEELPFSGRIPSLLSDDIKFQTIDRIKQIKENLLEFYPIREIALDARAQLVCEMTMESIKRKMLSGEDYYVLKQNDGTIYLSANSCEMSTEYTRTIDLVGPIRLLEVDVYNNLVCQWDCKAGILSLDNSNFSSKMEIVLDSPDWERDGVKGVAYQRTIRNIIVPEEISADLTEKMILSRISLPEGFITDGLVQHKTSAKFKMYVDDLRKKIISTLNEIVAELHSKLVLGLGCTTLILMGIALGIMFKGGHMLSAFGASSIPAGALIVCIMAGKNIAKNPSKPTETGVLVMWSGLVILTVLVVLMYKKLLKT